MKAVSLGETTAMLFAQLSAPIVSECPQLPKLVVQTPLSRGIDKRNRVAEDPGVTDDELVLAVRSHVAGRGLPRPASAEDVTAFERVVGNPMPDLLKRMYLEVANGGFGPRQVVSLTETDDWFSDCADITMAYHAFGGPDGDALPSGLVPLMDRGCAMWALIDFRTPDGQMWDWDPNLCCIRHALAPLGQSLAQWLTDWVRGEAQEGPLPHHVPADSACHNP
ncbi:SMI1/KNR4 family protein [Streptomyces sp. NPDC007940]|uniref:SMI1/KNR4 family protein n=1 Tax=Streptomyces sp. NPDC007940 TaxID=3364796 RepID=UPI0036E64D8C